MRRVLRTTPASGRNSNRGSAAVLASSLLLRHRDERYLMIIKIFAKTTRMSGHWTTKWYQPVHPTEACNMIQIGGAGNVPNKHRATFSAAAHVGESRCTTVPKPYFFMWEVVHNLGWAISYKLVSEIKSPIAYRLKSCA